MVNLLFFPQDMVVQKNEQFAIIPPVTTLFPTDLIKIPMDTPWSLIKCDKTMNVDSIIVSSIKNVSILMKFSTSFLKFQKISLIKIFIKVQWYY